MISIQYLPSINVSTSFHCIKAVFASAVVITLVPAHLFELRYFSPALVIAVISSSPSPHCGAAGVEAKVKEAAVLRNGPTDHGSNHGSDSKDKLPCDILFSLSHLQLVCVFCIVNVVTIGLFLHRPFKWNDGTTARFMY